MEKNYNIVGMLHFFSRLYDVSTLTHDRRFPGLYICVNG